MNRSHWFPTPFIQARINLQIPDIDPSVYFLVMQIMGTSKDSFGANQESSSRMILSVDFEIYRANG